VNVLSWDNGGFLLSYKRLEQGRFRLPAIHEGALGVQLDATQFAMLLDGIDLSHVRRPKKWSPQETEGARQARADLSCVHRPKPIADSGRTRSVIPT